MIRRRAISVGVAMAWTVGMVGFPTVSTAAATPAEAPSEGAPSPDAREVLARVNGERLYVEDVESVLARVHEAASEGDRVDFDLDQLLFRLVNDTLIAQEADALGLADDGGIPEKVEELRERLAKARLYKEEVIDRIEVDEETVRRVYDDIFRQLSLHVVTRRDRSEVERIRERLLAGEEFEAIAGAESEDFFRGRAGKVEEIVAYDLEPSLLEAASSLEVGELSLPFASNAGWTVVRLDRLELPDPAKFATHGRMARGVALQRRLEAVRKELTERLRGEHDVVVDAEALASIGAQRMPDGRPMPQIEGAERVVARVDGRAIEARQLGSALAGRWGNLVNPEVALAMKPEALDELIFDELLAVEAIRRGYGTTDAVERAVHAERTRLLVDRYLREVLASEVEIDREAAEAFYAEHREEYRRPPRLHVLQITVESQEEAERLAKLARDGADFAWLARQHSVDAFRESGGDRGWMLASEGLERFHRELRTARAGDVLGPSGAKSDWQIAKVTAFEDRGSYEFEEVSGNVRQRMVQEAYLERVDRLIQTLRERSEIWINEEAVARLRLGIGAPTPGTAPQGHGAAPGHSGG